MGLHSVLVLILFGLRPPAGSADYVAHDTVQGFSIGAAVVPADEVKRRFEVDLSRKGFIVVEVGIFPEPGSPVEIRMDDFKLESARALTAESVDARLNPKRPDIAVGGSATLGWESARDKGAGTKRQGGLYGDVSVGAGTASPLPRTDRTRDRLEDDSLPEGRTAQPVAGYLYFPKTAKKGPYQFVYYGKGETVKLTLP